jgi:hypothetical protein
MMGRLVERKSIAYADQKSQEIGSGYNSGVYNVVLTQGEDVKVLRMVK